MLERILHRVTKFILGTGTFINENRIKLVLIKQVVLTFLQKSTKANRYITFEQDCIFMI